MLAFSVYAGKKFMDYDQSNIEQLKADLTPGQIDTLAMLGGALVELMQSQLSIMEAVERIGGKPLARTSEQREALHEMRKAPLWIAGLAYGRMLADEDLDIRGSFMAPLTLQ